MLAAAPYVIWEMRLWLDYSIGFVIMLTVSTLLSTAPLDTSHKPGQQPTIIFYPALMSSTYSIIRFFKNMFTKEVKLNWNVHSWARLPPVTTAAGNPFTSPLLCIGSQH